MPGKEEIRKQLLNYAKQARGNGLKGIAVYTAIVSSLVSGVIDLGFNKDLVPKTTKSVEQMRLAVETASKYIESIASADEISGEIVSDVALFKEKNDIALNLYNNVNFTKYYEKDIEANKTELADSIKKYDDLQKKAVSDVEISYPLYNFDGFFKIASKITEMENAYALVKANPEFVDDKLNETAEKHEEALNKVNEFCAQFGISTVKDGTTGYSEFDQLQYIINSNDKERAKLFYETAVIRATTKDIAPDEKNEELLTARLAEIADMNKTKEELDIISQSNSMDKLQLSEKNRDKYISSIKKELEGPAKVIKEKLALLDNPVTRDQFYHIDNMSEYARALNKYESVLHIFRDNFQSKVDGNFNDMVEFGKHHFGDNFPDAVHIYFEESGRDESAKLFEELTNKILDNADVGVLKEVDDKLSKHIYPVDDMSKYHSIYAEGLSLIEPMIQSSTILSLEEKQKFTEISEYLKPQASLDVNYINSDERILDAVSQGEGTIAKEKIDSENLGFKPYDVKCSDIVLNSSNRVPNAGYYAAEYVYDEMEITPETEKNILDIVEMAEEMGIMQESLGGESGIKNYGLAKYYAVQSKLEKLLKKGASLKDEKAIAENAKEIIETADDLKKTKDDYDKLFDFIGDKLGEGVAGNIFSNRSTTFPKDWRLDNKKNRQCAQFNAICQTAYYAKEMGVPLKEFIKHPVKSYKEKLDEHHKQLLVSSHNDDKKLGVRLLGFFTQIEGTEYNPFAFRSLEALSKLEKNPEKRVHNAIVGSFASGYQLSKSGKDTTSFTVKSNFGRNSNVRMLLLEGDNAQDFMDITPGGFNPVTATFGDPDYKGLIKNNPNTPQQELDHLLETVCDYEDANEKYNIVVNNGRRTLVENVGAYVGVDTIRYHAQQCFADYVIQKGFTKGSPEYKLLEDYMENPGKVENEYRVTHGYVKKDESEVNKAIKTKQKDWGNRMEEYENPGKKYILEDQQLNTELAAFSNEQQTLSDKVFNETATKADKDRLKKINKEWSDKVSERINTLSEALANKEITQLYYDQRVNQLKNGEFTKQAEMFTKTLTEEEFAKLPEYTNFTNEVLHQEYSTYLQIKNNEVLDFIEEHDEKTKYVRIGNDEYKKSQKLKLDELSAARKEIDTKEKQLTEAIASLDKLAEKASLKKTEDVKALTDKFITIDTLMTDISESPACNYAFSKMVEEAKETSTAKFKDIMENVLHLSTSEEVEDLSEAENLMKLAKEGKDEQLAAFVDAADSKHWAAENNSPETVQKCKNLMGDIVANNVSWDVKKEDVMTKCSECKKEAGTLPLKKFTDTLGESMKTLNEALECYNGPDREKFFEYNQLSKTTRAYAKVLTTLKAMDKDFSFMAGVPEKSVGEYLKNRGVEIGTNTFATSLRTSVLLKNINAFDKLIPALFENAPLSVINQLQNVTDNYVYPIDNPESYHEMFKGVDKISENVEKSSLTEEQKQKFKEATEYINGLQSLKGESTHYDEDVLDMVSNYEGTMAKDHLDSLNLPFSLYDKKMDDLLINQMEPQAQDKAVEYTFDEMLIDESTKKNIKEVIGKAEELGLMEDAIGGESGGKSYGFGYYVKLYNEMENDIAKGQNLTDPKAIEENAVKITENAEKLQDCKAKYEQLFDFIGDKFGNGLAGNVFSNRESCFPKEWRTGDKNRQAAQFNAICQFAYFGKQMGIDMDEGLSSPFTMYRRWVTERNDKLMASDYNNNADSLGKRMAGYLISHDSYSIPYVQVQGRYLEALSKLEKNPAYKAHNSELSTFGCNLINFNSDKKATSFTDDKKMQNIRNIFLMGDKTENFADLSPDGFNLKDFKFTSSINYKEEIKNKENTPEQELENVMKAVIDFTAESQKLMYKKDPDTGEYEIDDTVSAYMDADKLRYQAQQYFADYVIEKGYKKGSPEFDLLKKYMENPGKMENEYRKKFNAPLAEEQRINNLISHFNDEYGNRYKDYTEPGHKFIKEDKELNKTLQEKYKVKYTLSDKVLAGTATEQEETQLDNLNKEISGIITNRVNRLTEAFEAGEIPFKYYNLRTKALDAENFDSVPEFTDKLLTKKEFGKLSEIKNLNKTEIDASYETYLNDYNSEILNLIEASDKKEGYIRMNLTPFQEEQRAKMDALSVKYKEMEEKEKQLTEAVKSLDELAEKVNYDDIESFKAFRARVNDVKALSGELTSYPECNKHFKDHAENKLNEAQARYKDVLENTLHLDSSFEHDTKDVLGATEAETLERLLDEGLGQSAKTFLQAAHGRYWAEQAHKVETANVSAQVMTTVYVAEQAFNQGESIDDNLVRVDDALRKMQDVEDVLNDYYSDQVRKTLSESMDTIHEGLNYIESDKLEDREKFFEFNNISRYTRAYGKVFSAIDCLKEDCATKVKGGYNSVPELLKANIPGFDNEYYGMSVSSTTMISNFKTMDTVLRVVLRNAKPETLVEMNREAKGYVYTLDNEAKYHNPYEKQLNVIESKLSSTTLSEQEKKNFADAKEFLSGEKSLEQNSTAYDENILDVMADGDGIISKKYVDDLNLPFDAYDKDLRDMVIVQNSKEAVDFGTEYVYDEMWIEDETKKDIREIIKKADELGIMDDAAGGESGVKLYGFTKYSLIQTKLKELLAEGEGLTDPEKISENVKKVTEASNELEEYRGRYEELFEFIGDKLGEGVAGNIFSNRMADFPKEWREEGKSKQMAQFNAICQISYFSKELGIPLDEFIDHPMTSYRRVVTERNDKLMSTDYNNDADSLGKRMAGHLTTSNKYSIDFTLISGRMLEAMAKLEKNPKNKVHNTMIMTFGGGTLILNADKDAISNFTLSDNKKDAKKNIRNIFLMGDKTHDFADLAPDGFNLSEIRPAKSFDYNEEIRNKETTPREELDNILKAVIDYAPEADRIVLDDPTSEDASIKETVLDYVYQSEIRYQGQQYFTDFVIQKGYKKGSPEYKLLEDYIKNPAKVENEYRKRNNLPLINENRVNAEMLVSQDNAGSRFKDYTEPGHSFIKEEEDFNKKITAKYREKFELQERLLSDNPTPEDEEALIRLNQEIATAVEDRVNVLNTAFEKGEITGSYYAARKEAIGREDFTKVPPMFEKVLTEKEYAKLHSADGLSKAELSGAYATYLDMREGERQGIIEATDEKNSYLKANLTPYQKQQREKLAGLSVQLKEAEAGEKEIKEKLESLDKLAEKAESGKAKDVMQFVKAFDRIDTLRNGISSSDVNNKYFQDFVSDTVKTVNEKATQLTRDKFHLASTIEADNLFNLIRTNRNDQAEAYIEAAKLRNSAISVGNNEIADRCAQMMLTAVDNGAWERKKDTVKDDFESIRNDIKGDFIRDMVDDIEEEKKKLDSLYAKYADKSEFYTNETAYEIAKSFDKIDQFVSDYNVANHFDKITDEGSKTYGDLLKKELPDCEFTSLVFNKKNPEKNMKLLEVIVPASEVILNHMDFESVERCHGKMKNWKFCIENEAEYKVAAEKEIANLKENSYKIPLTKEERVKLSDSLGYLESNLKLASGKVTDMDENYVNEEVTTKEANLVKEKIKDDETFPHESVAKGGDFLFSGLLPDAEAVTPFLSQDIVINDATAYDIISVIEKAESLGILDANSEGEQIRKGYGFSKYIESFNKARIAVEKDAKLTDKTKKAENAKEIIKAAEEFKEINNKYDELIEFIGDRFDDSIPGNVFTNREKEFPQKYRGAASKQCAQFNAISQIYSCCKANGIDIHDFLKNPVKIAYEKSVEAKENYAKNVLHSDTPEIGKRMAYFLTNHNALSSRKDFDKTTMRFGIEPTLMMRSLEAMCKLDPDNKVDNTIISAAARLIPNIAGYDVNNIFGKYTINGKQYDSSRYIRNFFASDPDELKDLGNASPYYYNISDKTAHTIDYASEIKNNSNTVDQEINKVMGIVSDYADEIDKAVKEAKDSNVYGGNVKTGDILFHAHEYMVDYMINRDIKPGSEEYTKIMDFINNPIESINDFRKQNGRSVLSAQVKKEYKEATENNPSRVSLIDGTLEEADREINKQLRLFAERKAELAQSIEADPENAAAREELASINMTIKAVTDQRIAELTEMGIPESYIVGRKEAFEVGDFRDVPFSFDEFMKQDYIVDELREFENDKTAYDQAAKEKYSEFIDEYYNNFYADIRIDDNEKNYMMGEALTEKQKAYREKNIAAYEKDLAEKEDIQEKEKEAQEFFNNMGEYADFDSNVKEAKKYFEFYMMHANELTDHEIGMFIGDIAKGEVKLTGIDKADITKPEEYEKLYGKVMDVLSFAGYAKPGNISEETYKDIKHTAWITYDDVAANELIVLDNFSDDVKAKIDVLGVIHTQHDMDIINTVGSRDINAAAQVASEFAGLSKAQRQELMIDKVAQMYCGTGYYPGQPHDNIPEYSEDEKVWVYGQYMQDLLDFTYHCNKIEPYVDRHAGNKTSDKDALAFGAGLSGDDFNIGGAAYDRVHRKIAEYQTDIYIKESKEEGMNPADIFDDVLTGIASGTYAIPGKNYDVFDDKQCDELIDTVKAKLASNGLELPESVNEEYIANIKENMRIAKDPNRYAAISFAKNYGKEITDYYDVEKAFHQNDLSNAVGSGNIEARVKIIKDLTAVQLPPENDINGRKRAIDARNNIVAGYLADLMQGKKIFPGQPDPIDSDTPDKEKAVVYGEYLCELISGAEISNKIEPLHSDDVSKAQNGFCTGVNSAAAFHEGTEIYKKAQGILAARRQKALETESKKQRTIYEAVVASVLEDEDDMPTLDDAISNNAHIFGGDPSYAPFETAAKNFNKSLKKNRELFDEEAFKKMTDEAKKFIQGKNNKAIRAYKDNQYAEYLSIESAVDKLRLNDAKKKGPEALAAEKQKIEADHLAEKERIEHEPVDEREIRDARDRYLSRTERERYQFAKDVLQVKEEAYARGLINIVENNLQEYQENDDASELNEKMDNILKKNEYENLYKAMDNEFMELGDNNMILEDADENDFYSEKGYKPSEFKMDEDLEKQLSENKINEKNNEDIKFMQNLDEAMNKIEDEKDIEKLDDNLNINNINNINNLEDKKKNLKANLDEEFNPNKQKAVDKKDKNKNALGKNQVKDKNDNMNKKP